jgi:hypothetical protein
MVLIFFFIIYRIVNNMLRYLNKTKLMKVYESNGQPTTYKLQLTTISEPPSFALYVLKR